MKEKLCTITMTQQLLGLNPQSACQSEYCWSSYQESKSSYLHSPASEVEINLWLHRQNINQQGFKSGGARVQPTSSTAVLLDYTVERKHEP